MRLHGAWIFEDEIGLKGKLFLWAEKLRPDLPRTSNNGQDSGPGINGVQNKSYKESLIPSRKHSGRREVRGRPAKPRSRKVHPYAVSSERLLKLIKVPAMPYQQPLLLLSCPSFPIPSSLMQAEIKDKLSLREWKTPGVILKDEICTFLALLDETTLKQKKILLGCDMIFLSKAARFALGILAKQRFLPSLTWQDKGDEKLVCFWQPVFMDDEEKRLFSHLKAAMPDSVRCAATKNIPSKGKLILHFLTFLINQTIRASTDYDLSNFFGRENYFTEREDRVLDVSRPDTIFSQFKGWVSPLKIRPQAKGFRTCFKLVPPEDNNKPWYLNFLLQSLEDQSLMVEVKDVWQQKEKALSALLEHSSVNQLLTDLGIATRLFPHIERALDVSEPYRLELNTHEAYSFLQEASLLLKECGFGVFVPSFWDMERKQGTRSGLKVKAMPSAGSSGFGLSQLVSFDWEIAIKDKTISKEEFESLVKLKVPLVNIRGQWVELQPGIQESILKYLEGKDGMPLGEFIGLSLGGGDEEEGLVISEVGAEGWLRELLESLKGDAKLEEISCPKDFVGTLRPYQTRGVSWMSYMNRFGFGVCLADDMGLGKTIQFIALLLHQQEQGLEGPTLLVCPTSVIGNWERELARFSPSIRALLHHGPTRLSGKEFREEATKTDVIITSYALIHRDIESFKGVDFRYIVLDEAQNIKNPYTKQAQAARTLKANLRVALTGTPIENRLSELWSIMEFLNPGYLRGITQFRRRFAIPIERYNDEETAKRLKSLIGPFMLRRLKTDPTVIADLPEKMEIETFCPLTKEQATLYQATVDETMNRIETSAGMKRKGEVLGLLVKLKQICNHPALFLHDRSRLTDRSGKLQRLKEMIEELLEEGDGALIFTQFAEMGSLLREYLEDALLCEVLFLCGGTSRKKREEMIARFQSEDGPRLFILSLKAGGLGLNLTRASRVFHFDRWWNPAVENQATDRAFRIGQKKKVMVYKFICQGTVEEKIDELLEKKKGLAEKVIGAGEDWITELSTAELHELFRLRKEAVME